LETPSSIALYNGMDWLSIYNEEEQYLLSSCISSGEHLLLLTTVPIYPNDSDSSINIYIANYEQDGSLSAQWEIPINYTADFRNAVVMSYDDQHLLIIAIIDYDTNDLHIFQYSMTDVSLLTKNFY
jgi:hypothetical protein